MREGVGKEAGAGCQQSKDSGSQGIIGEHLPWCDSAALALLPSTMEAMSDV